MKIHTRSTNTEYIFAVNNMREKKNKRIANYMHAEWPEDAKSFVCMFVCLFVAYQITDALFLLYLALYTYAKIFDCVHQCLVYLQEMSASVSAFEYYT